MTLRVLIQATGMARPGQLAGLGEALTEAQTRLLDINQSVTFDRVTLEALVALEAADGEQPQHERLSRALDTAAQRHGLEIRTQGITRAEYERWTQHAGAPRLILTLLAPRLPAVLLAELGQLTAKHGLTIELIHRLSGREALDGDASERGVCIECWLRGDPLNSAVDLAALRQQALAIGAEHDVDLAIQEDSIWRRHRRLICFDMDSTLIQAEVIDELARRHGVHDEVAAVTERAMRGELDFQQSFRERMSKLAGLKETVLAEIAEQLPLMPGVEQLLQQLRRLGYRTAILSGGFTYFAEHLQRRLGIDEIHANELVIDNGVVTGEVREPIVDADRKALLLEQIAEREGIRLEQVVAVGDGANDLKMLAKAGLGIAFRAKPLVRQQARQSLSTLGLDGVLYLLGYRDADRDMA